MHKKPHLTGISQMPLDRNALKTDLALQGAVPC